MYSAPELMIDYRYATLMLNISIAMIFGAGLPLLYPIALFNLCLLYTLDRLMTVYFYSQPPLFGISISNTALSLLKWVGLFHLAFGYWMLSNKQIFSSAYLTPLAYA
jgi:hypothetical protein